MGCLVERCRAAREQAAELVATSRRLRCERMRLRSALSVIASEIVMLRRQFDRQWLAIHRRRIEILRARSPMAETTEQLVASVQQLRDEYDREIRLRREMLGTLLKAVNDTKLLLQSQHRRRNDSTPPAS